MANVANKKPRQPGADVAGGQHVRELRGRDAERDDEGQVEQQFQRRRDAVAFVRIATRPCGESGGH